MHAMTLRRDMPVSFAIRRYEGLQHPEPQITSEVIASIQFETYSSLKSMIMITYRSKSWPC